MKVRKGLIVGIVLLLVVDVVWVGSAGISRHLFHDEGYDQPLFWTYFKTSLFSIYLSAFLFWRPWQRMCWEGKGRGKGKGTGGRLEGREGGEKATVMGSTKVDGQQLSSDGLEEDTSCGIDETTGQCTPNTPSHNGQEQGDKDEGCGQEIEAEVTWCSRKAQDTAERHTQTRTEITVTEKCTEKEACRDGELEFEAETCPAVLGRGGGGGRQGNRNANRNARVVDGHVYFHSASLNGNTCPLSPELETCKLVGPPEFRPLNCALSEEDRCKTGPLPSCPSKCCKVRFRRTIEVREARTTSTDEEPAQQTAVGPAPLLPVWKVALLSLVFGIVWFFANYLYALALVSKSVALVNTLSSMSSVFVMVMAALPLLHRAPGDHITLSRCLVSVLSVAGAVLVSISDSTETDHKYWSAGAFIALASAFLYAVYLVLLKKLITDADSIELPMFFGFVGLFDTILLLPVVLIWHYSGIEEFHWPPTYDVWTLILINGFIGTVISELLWLMGVFLTSPLVGTLSLALVTPLSITYSVLVGQIPFSAMFFVGALLILLCFVAVTVLDHFGSWDPLWTLIKKIVTAAKSASAHRGYSSLSEVSKSLIDNEDTSSMDQYNTY